jgi:16S rRNA (guanine966-N2)-methyltransferase
MAAGSGGPFELVFLDPPYRMGLVTPALAALRQGGWLAPDALIVAETAEDENDPPTDGFTILDARVYGDTRVWFLICAK